MIFVHVSYLINGRTPMIGIHLQSLSALALAHADNDCLGPLIIDAWLLIKYNASKIILLLNIFVHVLWYQTMPVVLLETILVSSGHIETKIHI